MKVFPGSPLANTFCGEGGNELSLPFFISLVQRPSRFFFGELECEFRRALCCDESDFVGLFPLPSPSFFSDFIRPVLRRGAKLTFFFRELLRGLRQ